MSDTFRDAVKHAQSEEFQRKVDHPHRLAVRDQEIAAEMRITMKDDPLRRNDYVRNMVEWSRVHRTISDRDNSGFIKMDRKAQEPARPSHNVEQEIRDRIAARHQSGRSHSRTVESPSRRL